MDKWFFHNAAWWQFWWPQSDFPGGLICGGIIILLVAIKRRLNGEQK